MNEEKIDLILKNQYAIMNFILKETKYSKGDLIDSMYITEDILNPTKQPSIAERTHDAFSKDGER